MRYISIKLCKTRELYQDYRTFNNVLNHQTDQHLVDYLYEFMQEILGEVFAEEDHQLIKEKLDNCQSVEDYIELVKSTQTRHPMNKLTHIIKIDENGHLFIHACEQTPPLSLPPPPGLVNLSNIFGSGSFPRSVSYTGPVQLPEIAVQYHDVTLPVPFQSQSYSIN